MVFRSAGKHYPAAAYDGLILIAKAAGLGRDDGVD